MKLKFFLLLSCIVMISIGITDAQSCQSQKGSCYKECPRGTRSIVWNSGCQRRPQQLCCVNIGIIYHPKGNVTCEVQGGRCYNDCPKSTRAVFWDFGCRSNPLQRCCVGQQ